MLEGSVREQAMSSPLVQEWAEGNPRLWWAFEHLDYEDRLADALLAGILKEDVRPSTVTGLVRFADALEAKDRAETAGTMRAPPAVGERRSFRILVTRKTKVNWNREKKFRVDFTTNHGWSGYFDTRNPKIISMISKSNSLMIVGEIERHLYAFLVVLEGRVRIV
jgi:hypothetical protein